MINFDNVIKEETKKKHNPNWPEIPNHPYRKLIIRGCGSRKLIHYLISLINHQSDID